VHEVPRLAVVDLTVLLLLGAWVELRSRALLAAVLASSALLSSAALWLLTDYPRYVGSSALSSGLLCAAILLAAREGRSLVPLVLGVLFAAKLVLEAWGAWPAALGGLPPGYEPATAAHVGGAVAGGLIAGGWRLRRQRPGRRPRSSPCRCPG
jgi:membrane associated rhomboid family serine protease